ncbi:hypothetical protein, partial [Streptomyces rubrogriseus]
AGRPSAYPDEVLRAAADGRRPPEADGEHLAPPARARYDLHTSPETLAVRGSGLWQGDGHAIAVDGRTVRARLVVTGVEFGPERQQKARVYSQDDEEHESAQERFRGLHRGGGPEAGGGSDDVALLNRNPYERGTGGEDRLASGAAGTDEHNRESVTPYRHVTLDVDVHLRGPRGTLVVSVPRGVTGMIRLKDGRLVGDLDRLLEPLSAAPTGAGAAVPAATDAAAVSGAVVDAVATEAAADGAIALSGAATVTDA